MKHIMTLAAALLAAGCGMFSSKPTEPKESAVDQKLTAMELRMETRDEQYRKAIEELHKLNQEIAKRVARQDQVISLVDATVGQLKDKARPTIVPVDTGAAYAAQPASEAPAYVPATADQAARMAEIAGVLRDPTFGDIARIKTELSPHAAGATAYLLQEITRHPSDTHLAGRAEDLIRSFPAADVRAPLTRALNDPVARVTAAQLIGRLADPTYAEVLHPFTTDLDAAFRLTVAVALVNCRDKRGVPHLIEGLASENLAVRIQSIQLLKRINRGESYRFDAWQGNAELNAPAVEQWRAWWEAMKDFVVLD